MPVAVAQPQYTAYNPSRHATPAPADAGVYGNNGSSVGGPVQADGHWPRESIGAVLDAYYEDPEYYDYADPNNGYHHHAYDAQTVHSEPAQYFSRPAINGGGGANYSGHPEYAHRGQSQPDLREGAAPYDGAAAEMPADVPPLPVGDARGGYMSAPRPNIPATLRAGSPASPPSIKSSAGPSQLHDASGLPFHPSPADVRAAETGPRHSHPDALPAHPPPIRPRLLPDGAGHPAPVRQYDGGAKDEHPIQNAQEGAVTILELDQLQQAVKLNPSDPGLQLTLAKRLVDAAGTLASEGGRADVKTTRKNRENYIFDAHKIVKRLTNSVRNPACETVMVATRIIRMGMRMMTRMMGMVLNIAAVSSLSRRNVLSGVVLRRGPAGRAGRPRARIPSISVCGKVGPRAFGVQNSR